MGEEVPDSAPSAAEVEEERDAKHGDVATVGEEAELLLKRELPSLEKARGHKRRIFFWLLVSLLAVIVAQSIVLRGKLVHAPFLHLEDAYVKKYVEEFNRAVEEMEEAWESSGPLVRRTFARFFTPSLSDDEENPDPLKTLRDHVVEMRRCKPPLLGNSYYVHLNLLTSICSGVADRLKQVDEMQRQHEESGVPVVIPGHDKQFTFPSLDELGGEVQSGMSAKQFLDILGVGASVSDEELERLPEVDKELAEKLVLLMTVESQRIKHNSDVLRGYIPFLGVFEGPLILASSDEVNYEIPYSGEIFETFTLGTVLERMYPEHPVMPRLLFEKEVRRVSRTWSAEVVLEAAKKQQKEYFDNWEEALGLRRKLMHEQMQKGMSRDNLLIYCIFLL